MDGFVDDHLRKSAEILGNKKFKSKRKRNEGIEN